MPEKEYVILLDIDIRKRHYHKTESGKITIFAVQLEIKHGGNWKTVLRYDCSHNFAHKDSYNLKGDTKKINLYMNYKDALTFADDDINENWQLYKEKFLRGDFS
jgi:hypothetical protein